MRDNFEAAFLKLQARGGPPNSRLGLTRKTVASWRNCAQKKVDLEDLQCGEAHAILQVWIWRGLRADELPEGLDYVLFERAVWMGVKQATFDLQRQLGMIRPSGQMDGLTLRAVEKANIGDLIDALQTKGDPK